MAKFEVGKAYSYAEGGFDPVFVVKRTDKTVWARWSSGSVYMLRVRKRDNGDEYLLESGVPKRYKDSYTIDARWEDDSMAEWFRKNFT